MVNCWLFRGIPIAEAGRAAALPVDGNLI